MAGLRMAMVLACARLPPPERLRALASGAQCIASARPVVGNFPAAFLLHRPDLCAVLAAGLAIATALLSPRAARRR